MAVLSTIMVVEDDPVLRFLIVEELENTSSHVACDNHTNHPANMRVEFLVHHLALALGGRPGARLADSLGLPVCNDTLRRIVRRYDCPTPPPPSVIGIDDWACCRNHRYGIDRRKKRNVRSLQGKLG